MPQTLTNEATEKKSENGRPSISLDDSNVMKPLHNYQMQRLLEISLAATMYNIREDDRIDTVDELLKILHSEEFYVVVLKAIVNTGVTVSS